MYDIDIVGDKLLMKKGIWDESELFLASCLWWDYNPSTGMITADLNSTLKKSVKEFLNMAYPTFMNNITYQSERNALSKDLKTVYSGIESKVSAIASTKVPYWNKMYQHQREATIAMYARRVTFLAFQQRVGKSLTMMSHSLATSRRRTVIVCMDVGKWNYMKDMTSKIWNDPVEAFSPYDFTILDSQKRKCVQAFHEKYVIVNYEAMPKYMDYIVDGTGTLTDHIVFDECFAYDTLITTDKGVLPIGYIVDNKVNCKALSVNYETGGLEFKEISAYMSNPLNKEIVLVKTSDGCTFACTNDHKIFVHGKGYVKAKDLQEGTDMLYSMRSCGHKDCKGQKNHEVLQSEMFAKMDDREHGLPVKTFGFKEGSVSTSSGNSELPVVQCGVCEEKVFEEKILLNSMFCEMEDVSAGSFRLYEDEGVEREYVASIKKYVCGESSSKREYKGTDDIKQSNERSDSDRENSSVIQGEDISIERREWISNKTTITSAVVNGTTYRVRHRDSSSEASISKSSESLQGRLSDTGKEDSDRSRRNLSQDEAMEVSGQEKDRGPSVVRVVSVEVLEQGSGRESKWLCGKNKVYDITVDDNHNYFANGILVSNCQAIKNTTSARHRLADKLIDACPDARITLMSGTPVMNRLDDMFAYFKLSRHPLGANRKKFDDMFIRRSSGRYSKVIGSKDSAKLFSMSSNFMIRKRLDECSDIPAKSHVKMYYPIGDWKEQYMTAVHEAIMNKGSKVRESSIHSINNIMAQAKIPGTFDFIKQLVDQDEKVVVFTSYSEPLNKMEQLLVENKIKYVRIDGSIDGKEKVSRAFAFNEDPEIMVAICNMKAAGHSINLSAASYINVINYPLSPMELDQAIFRTDTVDKKNKTTVYYSTCVGDDGENTVDMRLADLNESKVQDINNFVDKGKDVDDILNATDAIYSEILKQYGNDNDKQE